jgi:hypothetical protein
MNLVVKIMLDNTQKESLFFLSLKKYIIDTLYTEKSIFVDFGFAETRPVGQDEFVVVLTSGFLTNTVSSCEATFYLFSKTDDDGELAVLFDKVQEIFFDENDPQGIKRIPFYTESFVEVTKMIPYIQPPSPREISLDGFYFKYFDVVFRWGGK